MIRRLGFSRLCVLILTGLFVLTTPRDVCAQSSKQSQLKPKSDAVPRIDLNHILEGGVNRRGDLVGLHHLPSAPRTIEFNEVEHDVYFQYTSPGEDDDVRTARVELRDPKTGRVVLSKFSTCYPESWTPEDIEHAIRDAFEEAKANKKIDRDGKWEGRAKNGMRIDGYLSRDNKWISTAFPVYVPPKRDRKASDERDSPRDRNSPADPNRSRP
jgi:Bacterial EndoU nuclease